MADPFHVLPEPDRRLIEPFEVKQIEMKAFIENIVNSESVASKACSGHRLVVSHNSFESDAMCPQTLDQARVGERNGRRQDTALDRHSILFLEQNDRAAHDYLRRGNVAGFGSTDDGLDLLRRPRRVLSVRQSLTPAVPEKVHFEVDFVHLQQTDRLLLKAGSTVAVTDFYITSSKFISFLRTSPPEKIL
jgi:hypothetical protein